MNVIDTLQASFFGVIATHYQLSEQSLRDRCSFELITSEEKKAFGDITSNAAMVIAKELRQNPRALAENLIKKFSHPLVARVELAGPGFLNFFLQPEAFTLLFSQLHKQKDTFFKLAPESKKLKINIEFVSANPTGPLHFGHGRNGIIGDVLGNVLKFLGHNVTKEFYINDAGEQIRKLGMSFKIRLQQALGIEIELPEDAYHGIYLQDLAQKFLQEFGNEGAQKPDSFFEEYAKNHLLNALKTTLENYGIFFDIWFSEKQLHDSGQIQNALDALKANGFLFEQEGAWWFKSTAFGDDKDRVMIKTDGSLTYVSADAGYVENKFSRGFDKLIMVLGHDHHSFVQRLHGIMQALGYNPADLEVILYQLVRVVKDGALAKMSKRAGNIVSLEDIIETVGKDVARFFYLNRKADAELEFDVDLALQKSNENPVYYIQYAYVRTHSIIRKAKDEYNFVPAASKENFSEDEQLIVKKIAELKHLLCHISKTHQTHLIAYYTYEIANLFHKYYNSTKVIQENDKQTSQERLAFIQLIQEILGLCSNLMGISCPEKM